MKFLVVCALLIAAAVADDLTHEDQAQVLRFENVKNPEGYEFNYETSNKIAAREQGVFKFNGVDRDAELEVIGEFSYLGNDGKIYNVAYKAGRGGFQPSGAHLPQAPKEIKEYIYTH